MFAEFERDLLRERVRAGIAAAKKRGKPFGRPANARAMSDKIERLSAEGVSKRQISQRARHRAQLGSASHPQRESEMARGGLSAAVILRLNLAGPRAGNEAPAFRKMSSMVLPRCNACAWSCSCKLMVGTVEKVFPCCACWTFSRAPILPGTNRITCPPAGKWRF